MKQLEPITVDLARCRGELAAFKILLDRHKSGTLREKEHVLPFFRESRNLAALIGYLRSDCFLIDRIAYEFDIFGDHAADLVVGDSNRQAYGFVEFEDAVPDSIFRKEAKKSTLVWASRYERGYSQIIDWFWKLDDLVKTNTMRHRFEGAESIHYYGLLVIGRSGHLQPLEQARFSWRRNRVVVDSKHIYCMTFDELYNDLRDKLSLMGVGAVVEGLPPSQPDALRREPRKRPDSRS
jgi:Domain of unknown function (DUF4263)